MQYFILFFSDDKEVIIAESKVLEPQYASLPETQSSQTDLTYAAETSVKSEVRKNIIHHQNIKYIQFMIFFCRRGERRRQPSLASGSGDYFNTDILKSIITW